MPPNYYQFYSCPATRGYFWRYTGCSWALCILTGMIVMLPCGLKGKSKQYICCVAFLIAGWSTFPALYHMYLGDPNMTHEPQFSIYLVGNIIYSVGGILYALKFPERLAKGVFDIFGASHQIFHCMVVLAACIHFYASINEFHMRQLHTCP